MWVNMVVQQSNNKHEHSQIYYLVFFGSFCFHTESLGLNTEVLQGGENLK